MGTTPLRWLLITIATVWCLPTVSLRNEAAAAAAERRTALPQPELRTTRQIEGWNVRVDDRLLQQPNEEFGRRALRVLEGKLADIKLVVPAEALEALQKVTIVVDFNCGGLTSMQYHPSADWLTDNGYPADLEKCAHIPRAADLTTRLLVNEQPWAVLHELAHAYHDQVLGFDEARVVAAYERFMKSGRGDATLLYDGRRVRHYALTDQKEFFAEMTEAYFGVNDFYPFNRAELREAEPELFALLAQIWNAERHPAAPTGKAWVDMDYGPFMSMTLEAPQPAGNLAYKGIVVPLKPDRSAAMVFDTDLLRWSAGWRGSFIDWRNILYDGSHGTHCRVGGEQVFGTTKAPGWAKPDGESFDDPRELPFGPLPRDWGQWKGLYRHGDRIVLSYRIGDVDVLESPGLIERDGGTPIFTRQLRVGDPRKAPLLVAVSDTPGTTVELVGRGAQLARDGDRVRLLIAAGEEPTDVMLMIAVGEGAEIGSNAPPPPADLVAMTRGGRALYKPIVTKPESGKARPEGAFVVDTLTLPTDNPSRALVRPGGIDFFAGGKRAAVCTWDGDVWLVDGITGDVTGELKWTRFATGLFQPLGLVVRDDVVYVLGRDQITRLHDLNGDGEADWYEAFNHDAQVTEHFHEFAMDLQVAPGGAGGDFYYMKGACHAKDATVPQHGTLMRVSADGGTSEIVCYGFRAPNGLAVGRDGQFFTTDQQGHWTPANRLNRIEPGKFYGYNLAYLPRPKPEDYEPPVLWLHPKFDRSPAQPFFVDSDKWGPLAGKLLLSSYGTGRIELILPEVVDGRMQGGAVKLHLPQAPTGVMRSRFNPADGQLYGCGLFGWAGDRTQPGGLYRIRYTGGPLRMPIELYAVTTGMVIRFSDPLDAESAADVQSYAVSRWNYTRTAGYGSPDRRVSDGQPGQEPVTVELVRLSKDRRTFELRLADMRPAMQMQIQYDLESADGRPVRGEIHNTVHALGDPAGLETLFE